MTEYRYAKGDRLVVTGDTKNWGHSFKVGTVVTVTNVSGPRENDGAIAYWCVAGTSLWWVHEDDLHPVAVDHPVVVIDPEDTEAVYRLHEFLGKAWGWTRSVDKDDVRDMQKALRQYARHPPPKPDEPQGLGAVVEDPEGARWVRTNHPTRPWRHGYATLCWDRVGAVRVLSEGVPQ